MTTTVNLKALPALQALVGQVSHGVSFNVTDYNNVTLTNDDPLWTLTSFAPVNTVAFTSAIQSIADKQNDFIEEDVRGISTTFYGVTPTVQNNSVAYTSTIFSDTGPLLSNTLAFTDSVTPLNHATVSQFDSVLWTSAINPGHAYSDTTNSNFITTSAVTPMVSASLVPSTSNVVIVSSLTTVFVPSPETDTSSFTTGSLVDVGPVNTELDVNSDFSVLSTEYHVDPSKEAWVLNTETTALSRYESYGFNSIAALGTSVLGAGPDGLYLLNGDDDAGSDINATLESGFMDFKDVAHKRIDSVYVGQTSNGDTNLVVETYGPTPGKTAFVFQARPAAAPGATRAIIGKGLSSRYWRFTYGNVQGADFAVDRIDLNIMVTQRRV